MRRAPLLLLLACVGCQGEVTTEMCRGALHAGPVVLAAGLDEGLLLADGRNLIHIEHHQQARVRRIDGCSGAVEELGAFERMEGAAIHGGFVYAHHIGESDHRIARLPLSGGDAEHVVSLNDVDQMVAYEGGLYVFGRSEADGEHRWLRRLSPDSQQLELMLDIDVSSGFVEYAAIAASEAGVYFTPSYEDCGCTPKLQLWSQGSSELMGLDGSAGARVPSVVDGGLVVARNASSVSGKYEIARLPLAGGEGDVLVAHRPLLAPFATVVASADLLCWRGLQGPPSCVRPGGSSIRKLGDRAAESLVVIDEAAYWLQQALDSTQYELVATAVP